MSQIRGRMGKITRQPVTTNQNPDRTCANQLGLTVSDTPILCGLIGWRASSSQYWSHSRQASTRSLQRQQGFLQIGLASTEDTTATFEKLCGTWNPLQFSTLPFSASCRRCLATTGVPSAAFNFQSAAVAHHVVVKAASNDALEHRKNVVANGEKRAIACRWIVWWQGDDDDDELLSGSPVVDASQLWRFNETPPPEPLFLTAGLPVLQRQLLAGITRNVEVKWSRSRRFPLCGDIRYSSGSKDY